MKRILFLVFAITITFNLCAQKKNPTVILPGNGHIDIEKLNKPIDTNIDISKLSISELRVLRNAFAARQGYLFMSADLRSLFSQTSWYDSLMWQRFDGQDSIAPIKYSKEEDSFIQQLKSKEDELMKSNFRADNNNKVNINNLVNPFQLETFQQPLKEALAKNGFAIVPNNFLQLFQIYEKNDYHDFPSFVTTDLYLQLFHLYFDCALKEIEQNKLSLSMTNLCSKMINEMRSRILSAHDKQTKDAAEYNLAYFSIAYSLITGKPIGTLPLKYRTMLQKELQRVNNSVNDYSDFLGYKDIPFNYSLFKPRGHYTRNISLKRYFKAMMWLQTVPFGTDKPQQLRRALLIAEVIGGNAQLKSIYNKVSDPISYLMGTPDNITVLQVYDIIKSHSVTLAKLMSDEKALNEIRASIEQLAQKQTRIKPKFEYSSRYKINLMPQRYMPDAEVLQEMVDYQNEPTKRATPKGLDVMAAMGCSIAEQTLIDELKEDSSWNNYKSTLSKMKLRIKDVDFDGTIATKWMAALKTMTDKDTKYPYFMQSLQWDKKNLNAALASWAELKHDAILYAKQPMGAECGGAIPDPVVKGYVEPNTAFWTKALSLLDATKNVYKKYDLANAKINKITERIREITEFLLSMSNKELSGQKITDMEYKQIEKIGATFENISLDLIREPNQFLQGWDDVKSEDKSIAVTADVYTANADNNPHHSILYEGVGPADDIYVVIEMDGYLYLTRGAVFSYREYQRPTTEQRMTDGEWQKELKIHPRLGVPTWMNEITVPLPKAPEDNETIFYSSGC